MTYRRILFVSLLLTQVPALFPTPAQAIEIWNQEQQRRRQQQYTPPATTIDNPDEPIENSIIDYVWGESQAQAEKRCRNIAKNNGLKFWKVKRTSRTGKKWECHVLNNHPEP